MIELYNYRGTNWTVDFGEASGTVLPAGGSIQYYGTSNAVLWATPEGVVSAPKTAELTVFMMGFTFIFAAGLLCLSGRWIGRVIAGGGGDL